MNMPRLAILLLAMAFCTHAKSQDSLSISNNFWAHDTAMFDDTIQIYVTVQNIGSTTIGGPVIGIQSKITNSGVSNWPVDFDSLMVTNFGPTDTAGMLLSWIADTTINKYAPGNNITVIWPAHSGYADSLMLNTYIGVLDGIVRVDPIDFALYPNPANDKIWLDFPSLQGIESVRLTDMSGRLVFQEKPAYSYDVSNLTEGTYVMVIHKEDGRRSTGLVVIRR